MLVWNPLNEKPFKKWFIYFLINLWSEAWTDLRIASRVRVFSCLMYCFYVSLISETPPTLIQQLTDSKDCFKCAIMFCQTLRNGLLNMTFLQKRLTASSDSSRMSFSVQPNKKKLVSFALYSAIDMLGCLSWFVCSKCIYLTANSIMSLASLTSSHAVRFSFLIDS